MGWILLTSSDCITTRWSGGTTTQLAIGPAQARYEERDFLWRLSSARVSLPHSDFTSLPEYNRFLSVLEGTLEIRVGSGPRSPLPRFAVLPFDGGVPVESWGICTDFNLMLRKNRCRGTLQPLFLDPNDEMELRFGADSDACSRTLALFCVRGRLSLPDSGLTAAPGNLLLCRDAPTHTPVAAGQAGAEALAAFVTCV